MSHKDPGILCFEHCSRKRVFCFKVPEICPVCRAAIVSDSSIIPFRIPYPFVKASQYPCSVVIKPTNGDFLNDYKLEADLHIGVTSSRGKTYEFDRDGLSRGGRPWEDCLLVYQLDQEVEEEVAEIWDPVLEEVSELDSWSPQRYNEETFNCYTFVLAFLRCLKHPPLSAAARDRGQFSEVWVSPRAALAWKYIKLYRRLNDSGYYVNKHEDNDTPLM